MDRKYKRGFSPLALIGTILAIVGVIQIAVGVFAGKVLTDTAELTDSRADFRVFTRTFIGTGLLFLVIGAVLLGITIYSAHRKKKVFETGECIMADFVCFEQILNVTVNGRHPYRVKLSGRDLYGEQRDFYSGSLPKEPTAPLSGRQIPVYIDRDDPENYYVDLDSVLSEN